MATPIKKKAVVKKAEAAPVPTGKSESIYHHVMVDLETTGTTAGWGILSIGAVMFDGTHNQLGQQFEMFISRESCRSFGLKENPDTLAWWARQSAEARAAIDICDTGNAHPLDVALKAFGEFVRQAGPGKVKVWGNGGDFDQPILAAGYEAIGEKLPWQFWNNRCYRTVKSHHPKVNLVRSGTHHNALDDAMTQAMHLLSIWKPEYDN